MGEDAIAVLLKCLDLLTSSVVGSHELWLRMFWGAVTMVKKLIPSKKRSARLLVHTVVGVMFTQSVTLGDLRNVFGFSKFGATSVIPQLQTLHQEILGGKRWSFEREGLYENGGQYDDLIDKMITDFWVSEEASVESPGVKRKWVDPLTGKCEMKVVRVVLFPTRLEAWQRFCELHGFKCKSISLAQGHTKRLIPSADYMWKLKPNYVVYQTRIFH